MNVSSARRVLCDAGPLIALGKLGRLDLLPPLYGSVTIAQAVYKEVVVVGAQRGYPDALAARLLWRQQRWPVISLDARAIAGYTPSIILDRGEQETLALALTLDDPLVLIDDEVARAEARRLNLRVRGTIGVLVQAYHRQILTYNQIELLLQEVAARPDIWISAQLCHQALNSLRTQR